MRIKNLKPYYLKHRGTSKDKREGIKKEVFSEDAVRIEAYIYDDTQRVQPAAGGIRYIAEKIMLLDVPETACVSGDGVEKHIFDDSNGNEEYISTGDGICVYVPPSSPPDYRIASIIHAGHLVCRLERI